MITRHVVGSPPPRPGMKISLTARSTEQVSQSSLGSVNRMGEHLRPDLKVVFWKTKGLNMENQENIWAEILGILGKCG